MRRKEKTQRASSCRWRGRREKTEGGGGGCWRKLIATVGDGGPAHGDKRWIDKEHSGKAADLPVPSVLTPQQGTPTEGNSILAAATCGF